MAARMGVREFRENFTAIARDATEPVIVTNHDKVVGWFTPAKRDPKTVREVMKILESVRRRAEKRGIDVAGRLKALGLEDETSPEDPLMLERPKRARKRK